MKHGQSNTVIYSIHQDKYSVSRWVRHQGFVTFLHIFYSYFVDILPDRTAEKHQSFYRTALLAASRRVACTLVPVCLQLSILSWMLRLCLSRVYGEVNRTPAPRPYYLGIYMKGKNLKISLHKNTYIQRKETSIVDRLIRVGIGMGMGIMFCSLSLKTTSRSVWIFLCTQGPRREPSKLTVTCWRKQNSEN